MRLQKTDDLSNRTIYLIVGLLVLTLIGGAYLLSSMREARAMEVSPQQARIAIVKAISLGYSCREKNVTLPQCVEFALAQLN